MWKSTPCGPICLFMVWVIGACTTSTAAELHLGGATVSITPDQPVPLSGQLHTRIAETVDSAVTATALALESREGDKSLDSAILVSCDVVAIPAAIPVLVRKRLAERLPEFDTQKLVLSATHTHTAPVMEEGVYRLPETGILQPKAYAEFLADRVADAAVKAWQARRPGRVGWGLGYATVAQNRRSVYADGRAQMYGPTQQADFRGFEGYEDHGVEVLCFWNEQQELFATAINVACPSQEVEGLSAVNADFWHPVRESLRARHGKDLLVLGWTGAAGDQSPHLMYRKAADDRMRSLRKLSRLDDLARRIVNAWEEAYAGAQQEQHPDAVLVHKVQTIELPVRHITSVEAEAAREQVANLSKDPAQQRRRLWHQDVVERFERQESGQVEPYRMPLHVLRLGDVAITTNDFELFTDFGVQIKARSRALQTFVVQLAGPGTYIPSERAARGGGYSAIAESNVVGPHGGQVLADRTVDLLDELFPDGAGK